MYSLVHISIIQQTIIVICLTIDDFKEAYDNSYQLSFADTHTLAVRQIFCPGMSMTAEHCCVSWYFPFKNVVIRDSRQCYKYLHYGYHLPALILFQKPVAIKQECRRGQGKEKNMKRATFHTSQLPARLTQKTVFLKNINRLYDSAFFHPLLFYFFFSPVK